MNFALLRKKAARPKRRSTSTKATARHCGFVAASPSRSRLTFSVNRDLRDGEGDFARYDREGPRFFFCNCEPARLREGVFNCIIGIDLVASQRQKQRKKRASTVNVSGGVRLIAAFKLFKGLVLLAVGIGALKLLHKDLALEVEHWADLFRVDPNNRYLHRLLAKVLTLDPRKLRELSVGTFFYAAMDLTEGTGLFLGKRWAEYFTIITTSSFIPLEIYEVARHMSAASAIVLLLNIAVVIYLILELFRKRGNNSN
ncbi:MAG TPA: DUF2127 domain-containing protein [Candidatus Saccharimonadales bacterium]|nr:DUF2127 domain-containing protein [Candidatus Saccharimonadales bacterium]